MAAVQILAVAATAAASSDVTVAAGSTLTVSLKSGDGSPVGLGAVVRIELKDDGGSYNVVDILAGLRGMDSKILAAAGVYRFSRAAGVSCGVFSG